MRKGASPAQRAGAEREERAPTNGSRESAPLHQYKCSATTSTGHFNGNQHSPRYGPLNPTRPNKIQTFPFQRLLNPDTIRPGEGAQPMRINPKIHPHLRTITRPFPMSPVSNHEHLGHYMIAFREITTFFSKTMIAFREITTFFTKTMIAFREKPHFHPSILTKTRKKSVLSRIFSKKRLQVQRVRRHVQLARRRARLRLLPVDIKLDAIVVRVAQGQGFGHAMIRSAHPAARRWRSAAEAAGRVLSCWGRGWRHDRVQQPAPERPRRLSSARCSGQCDDGNWRSRQQRETRQCCRSGRVSVKPRMSR